MTAGVVMALVRKDLRIFLSDRRSMIMSFVAPITIASFFGFIFSGEGRETGRIPVRVVDQDGSAISRAAAAGLAADKNLAALAATLEEARSLVRAGKVTVAVVIPAGFGAAAGRAFFATGAKPQLELLYDPSERSELGMVRGVLVEHVMQAVSRELMGGTQGRELVRESLSELPGHAGMDPEDRAALRGMLEGVSRWQDRQDQGAGDDVRGRGFTMPYEVREEALTARAGVAYNSFAHSFAGMGVQFLLFACIDLAIGLLLERERGLWKRLRAAPLSRATLLAGRTVSGTLIALMSLWVTFAFGMAVFGIRIQGSVLGFIGVSVAIALMASTFGLLIASVGRTPGATRGVAILTVLLMVMLGGAWVPSFVFPAWLQRLTLVVPARWAVDGLDATTWRGVSLEGVLLPIGVLLGFALLFGLLAVARFRWEAE